MLRGMLVIGVYQKFTTYRAAFWTFLYCGKTYPPSA
ncbi:hypothetical protein RCCS2_12084 [Roseobacter sp. CCS2]|nr:hypothetical protein RCCS2_12084 [Roseobacter sp. CCS2]